MAIRELKVCLLGVSRKCLHQILVEVGKIPSVCSVCLSTRQHHDGGWKLSLKYGRNISACLLLWSKASLLHRLLVLKLENSTYDVSTKLIWNPVASDTAEFEQFVFSSGTF